MTVEEYTRARLMKEGAAPDQIETIIEDMRKEFGPAHLAMTMPQEAVAQVDSLCDRLRDAAREVLDRVESDILASRRKTIEGN